MKKLIIGLLVVFLMLGCQDKELEEVKTGMTSGLAVQEASLVKTGSRPGELQLAFLEPEEEVKGFKAWLLLYSKAPFEEVYEALSARSPQELEKLGDLDGANELYYIENFDYADGVGNTLNPNQKEFASGQAFDSQPTFFYVATLSEEGVVGLAMTKEYIDLQPQPTVMALELSEEEIRITYQVDPADEATGVVAFLSQQDLYSLQEEGKSFTEKDLKELEKKNRGLYQEALSGDLVLAKSLLPLSGQASTAGPLEVYLGAVGPKGLLGITRTKVYLTPDPATIDPTVHDQLGTIVLAGGGISSSGSEDKAFFEALKDSSGQEKPRIAIISSSRGSETIAYEHFYKPDEEYGALKDNYEALGFEPVYIPLGIDTAPEIANDPYWAQVIRSCDIVFLQGGDQAKHIKSLLMADGQKSKLLMAIEDLYDQGGVVAGTSAGMAAMGNLSYSSGLSEVTLTGIPAQEASLNQVPLTGYIDPEIEGNNLLLPGIGLLPDQVIVDSHFDARGRIGRLLSIMRDTGKTLGLGVDEKTALFIQNQVGRVQGDHGVFIIDGEEALYTDKGSPLYLEGARLHYLTQGDRFDFWSGKPLLEGSELTATSETRVALNPIAGDYSFTKSLLALRNQEEIVLGILGQEGPLSLKLVKSNDSLVKEKKDPYQDEVLQGFIKTSFSNLDLSLFADESEDTLGPVISYMKHYTKAYKVYLGISDNKSGLDLDTINGDTVQLISEVTSLYEPPFYDEEYEEIGIIAAEDFFTPGDQVRVEGIMDLAGNPVTPQLWRYDGQAWQRIE